MVGFIKLHRKLQTWEWYNKSEMVHLFIHLLINANSEDKPWQNIVVKRGQLVTGFNSLSEKTGISVRTLRTCFDRLKSTRELSVKTTNKYSVVTICKYDDYNDIKVKTDKQNDTQRVTPPTTTKKYKNKEGIYIDNILLSKLSVSDFIDGSDEQKYFKIAIAFVKVFKNNKKSLGDENYKHLNEAKFLPYVEPIRLLMKIDKRTKEEIETVFNYLKGGESSFWKPNILSTTKLREKFEKLIIASKQKNDIQFSKNISEVYSESTNKIDHSLRED